MHTSGSGGEARGALFYFALPLLYFQGLGGRGEGVEAALYFQRRRYWYAPADGVASVQKFLFFCASAVQFSWTGWLGANRCLQLSTFSGGAFGIHASGYGERCARNCFLLCLRRSIVTDWVEEEKEVPAGLTFGGGTFSMHASGPGERACRMFSFCASAVHFLRTRWVAGKGCRRLSTLSGNGFGMHTSESRERVRVRVK